MNPMAWLNPGRWILYLALAGALVAGYFSWADHIGDKREAQVRAQYQKQADDANATRAAIGPPIVKKEAAAQVKIRTVFQTIIKEVPKYVSVNDCPMSPGFRVFHDSAANGQLPDPARIPDAAAVPASDVANTVAGNYETCLTTATRLTGLQEWVKAQAAAK